jgi:ribose 5-phosphate isomerase B
MKIAVGCDSFGYYTKLAVLRWLKVNGHEALDVGISSDEPDNCLCDYADAVCEAVLAGKAERGVLVCGTGAAMMIRANRWPGIRAVLCRGWIDAKEARQNTNMNIMVLQGFYQAPKMVDPLMADFLTTVFEPNERRLTRMTRFDAPVKAVKSPKKGGPKA